ncbi:MAG: hypothetical protein KKG88_06655 [Proteobacteria bacterium]|jgi:hypothetical protein|nr:hypothetical protein [Pseudomonadota bacterium]MBU4413229.1 hypothetical protein [Pseudomonadota bacterium]MCG2823869.1 hypothetical protein [Desulfobulbaceae bacterium]
MTFRIKSVFPLVAPLLGFLLLLPGCATTGSGRAEKTTAKMEVVDSEIRQAVVQIDATGLSLEKLITPGLSDTKGAFETYSENVVKMERLGEKLIKHTDEMSVRGKDYFAEWEKQGNTYTNPQIRELSEQRRSDLNTVYRKISESSIGVKGWFIAYMRDIKEIQSFLSTDLTDKGIASITPVARKAINDGTVLRNAVLPVLSALDGAKREMAQGGAN